MSAEKTAYCNILRDADKIDIFRVNCDTPLEDIYNVSTAELKQAAVSDLVKKCFMEKHTVLRSLKHTPVDNLVGHVCLVFVLVYPDEYTDCKGTGICGQADAVCVGQSGYECMDFSYAEAFMEQLIGKLVCFAWCMEIVVRLPYPC